MNEPENKAKIEEITFPIDSREATENLLAGHHESIPETSPEVIDSEEFTQAANTWYPGSI